MQILAVNVGLPKPIPIGDEMVSTGIFKTPEEGAVTLTPEGFEGDEQADKKNHGGVDQAVYVYSAEDYAWWSEQLGRDLSPGMFGENLTLSEFPKEVKIGDRLELEEVILEVTAPRIPCNKFAAKMNDPKFVKRFREAERPGFYTRVIQTGAVRAGEEVTHKPAEDGVSLLETNALYFAKDPDPAALDRALEAPLAERLRKTLEGKQRTQLKATSNE